MYIISDMPTYISKEGLAKLEEELADRKTRQRKDIAERISSAKELGDLSENFEYHDAKEAQGTNEMRIVQLETMIKEAEVVAQTSGTDTVELGTTFVATLNGVEKVFELVGSSEADPLAGKISNESPIGRAFHGRRVGESVEVETPSGKIAYTVLRIR